MFDSFEWMVVGIGVIAIGILGAILWIVLTRKRVDVYAPIGDFATRHGWEVLHPPLFRLQYA